DACARMRAVRQEGEAERAPQRRNERAESPTNSRSADATPKKRKRRFPYRKVEDLEAEIAAEEERLAGLEARMASPDLYRDGDRVKETTRAFEETQARLRHLYEHWEEAM